MHHVTDLRSVGPLSLIKYVCFECWIEVGPLGCSQRCRNTDKTHVFKQERGEEGREGGGRDRRGQGAGEGPEGAGEGRRGPERAGRGRKRPETIETYALQASM